MHLEQYGEPHFNFLLSQTSTRVSMTAWKYSSLPTHWDPQSPWKVVHLVSLQTSSQEYQDVLTHFKATGGVSTQIINIERVQNPGLYQQYLAKKATMDGGENEKQLFHGTRFANTPSINANNFNGDLAETKGDLRLNWEVKINHENVQDDAISQFKLYAPHLSPNSTNCTGCTCY